MSKKLLPVLIAALLLSTSCSSTRKSITLGLGIGAGTGAAIGAATSKNHDKGAMTGGLIGALVGGIASFFVDKGLQERDQTTRRDTLFNLEKHGVFGPSSGSSPKSNLPYGLSPAVVDEQYVETHVEDGTRLIEGHKVWTIREGSQWTHQANGRDR